MKQSEIDLIELEIHLKNQQQTITTELEIVERLQNRIKGRDRNGRNE